MGGNDHIPSSELALYQPYNPIKKIQVYFKNKWFSVIIFIFKSN